MSDLFESFNSGTTVQKAVLCTIVAAQIVLMVLLAVLHARPAL